MDGPDLGSTVARLRQLFDRSTPEDRELVLNVLSDEALLYARYDPPPPESPDGTESTRWG